MFLRCSDLISIICYLGFSSLSSVWIRNKRSKVDLACVVQFYVMQGGDERALKRKGFLKFL